MCVSVFDLFTAVTFCTPTYVVSVEHMHMSPVTRASLHGDVRRAVPECLPLLFFLVSPCFLPRQTGGTSVKT